MSETRFARPPRRFRAVELLERRRLLSAAISGTVIWDTNADGTIGSSETVPLWGATVYADVNHNGALDADEPSTALVFPSMNYRLSLPRGGTYEIRTILPGDYVASVPASGSMVVSAKDGFTTSVPVFGGWTAGSYAARPFDDADSDGVRDLGDGGRDPGEAYAYNRPLWADLDRDGSFDADEPFVNGNASVAKLKLRPGTYSFRLAAPTGWVNTTAPDGIERTVKGDTIGNPDPLGQKGTRNLQGTVANDVNGNERLDAGDAVLAGWTVFADLDRDGTRDVGEPSTVTAADGTYALVGDALASRFNLRLIDPRGVPSDRSWSYDTAGTSNPFGNDDLLIRVTNVAVGRIFVDLNGDGAYQSTSGYSEPFAPGVTVYADVNGNGTQDAGEPATRTEGSGYFFFAVPDGTFAVRPVDGNGFSTNPAFPAFAPATYSNDARVSLGALGMLDASPTRTRTFVSGVAFEDLNRNARRDPGEPALPDQIVYFDRNANGVRDAGDEFLPTGVDGAYLFTDLAGGGTPAVLRVETVAGWRNVPVGDAEGRPVSPSSGGGTYIDAGVYRAAEVGIASASLNLNGQPAIELTMTHDLGSSLQAGDFVLYAFRNGAWSVLPMTWSQSTTLVDGRSTTVLRPAATLADGNYSLQLPPGSIADVTGRKNTSAGSFEFFVLAGDANHDRTVGPEDFNALASHFGQTGRTFSHGDFDNDGTVGPADFNILASRFGTTLASPPTTAPAAQVATPAPAPAPAAPLLNAVENTKPVTRRQPAAPPKAVEAPRVVPLRMPTAATFTPVQRLIVVNAHKAVRRA